MKLIKKYSHLILSFTGTLFFTVVLLCFNQSPTSLIVPVLAIGLISFWYEWKQAVDPYMLLIYGGLDSFIKDSKGDIRQDMIGIFIGAFFSIPVWLILC